MIGENSAFTNKASLWHREKQKRASREGCVVVRYWEMRKKGRHIKNQRVDSKQLHAREKKLGKASIVVIGFEQEELNPARRVRETSESGTLVPEKWRRA